jgi:type 1 glutamine amidotransferase
MTRDVPDFEVADEQHTPDPDRSKVHMLLESRSAEGVMGAAGWAYQAGRGRVCYLANGHTREALLQPAYQKLLRNAVRWCLGRDE